VVLLAQLDDGVAGSGLFRLGTRAGAWGGEEDGIGLAAEVVADDVDDAGTVGEVAGDFLGWAAVDEIGAEGLVDALSGGAGFEEEAAALT
jgi:hypothetical protein